MRPLSRCNRHVSLLSVRSDLRNLLQGSHCMSLMGPAGGIAG